MSATIVQFQYVNWKDEEHEYVVDFTTGFSPGLGTSFDEKNGFRILTLSGYTISRDGNPRVDELGSNRRRSFEIYKMKNIKVIG